MLETKTSNILRNLQINTHVHHHQQLVGYYYCFRSYTKKMKIKIFPSSIFQTFKGTKHTIKNKISNTK